MTIRHLAVALALAVVSIGPAGAADWPTRPIRIIAPSTRAAPRHVRAAPLRAFRRGLPRALLRGEPRRRRRAARTAATAQAAPDGYTLTTSSTAYHVIAPVVSANPGFDPLKDFTHIAYVGGPPNAFVVNPALGVRSLAELVALGRRGQRSTMSRPRGNARAPGGGIFAQKAGIKLQQIMTKGASQGMMDLIAGTVNVGTMTWTSALSQIRAGKVIPIAVTASRGWRNFRICRLPRSRLRRAYGGVVVRPVGASGLPSEITLKLNASVAQMLERPDIRRASIAMPSRRER